MTEILLIVAVALLLFGGRRVADLGRSLGEGIRNFRKGVSDDDPADNRELPPDAPAAPDRRGPPP